MNTKTKIILGSLGLGLVIVIAMTVSHFQEDAPSTTTSRSAEASEVTTDKMPSTTSSPNLISRLIPAQMEIDTGLRVALAMVVALVALIFLRQLAKGNDTAWLVVLIPALIIAGFVGYNYFGTVVVTKVMETKYQVPSGAYPEVHRVTSEDVEPLRFDEALRRGMKARWGIKKPKGVTLLVFQSESKPEPSSAKPDMVLGPEREGYIQLKREPKADGSYLRESTEPLWVIVYDDQQQVIEIIVVYLPYRI